MSDDLHTRLRTAIEEMLDLARPIANEWVSQMPTVYMDGRSNGAIRPASGGPYAVQGSFAPGVDHFIAAHDPAWAIRQHEAALRVLERHRRDDECLMRDCLDVEELAGVYGVPIDLDVTP